MATTIDFAGIVERTDLAALISADVGAPLRGGRWLCPFHDDTRPDLGVGRDGRRFKCWACGANGTALDWLMLREGIDVVEAARVLDGATIGLPARRRAVPTPTAKPAAPSAWEDAEWQEEADRIVCLAEGELWSQEGRPALDWLRRRGLADRTIRKYRLGFLPEAVSSRPIEILIRDGRPRSIWAPRGVTIPWLRPGSWYDPRESPGEGSAGARWVGVNVRRLADGDVFGPLPRECGKCHALTGSARGFGYPWGELLETQGSPPALITEGEIDALLADQECGHLVFAMTVGGATQEPHSSGLTALAFCPRWLVATDHDAGGADAALRWHSRAPHKYHRMLLPHGKDIGEFVAAGGDLADWLRSEAEQIRAAMAP